MNLQKRVLLVVGLTVLILLLMQYITISRAQMAQFVSMEKSEIENNLLLSVNLLNRETKSVARTDRDYAEWDDTYLYALGRYPEYIDSNMANNTYAQLELNAIVILDAQGDVLYIGCYNLSDGSHPSMRGGFISDLSDNYRDGLTDYEGLISTPDGPAIISSASIMMSNLTGPRAGSVIMIRYLTSDKMTDISSITGRGISLAPLDSQMLGLFPPNASTGAAERLAVEPLGSMEVAGYALLDDIHGMPHFVLKLIEPRTLFLKALTSMNYTAGTLIVVSVVMAAVLITFIDWFIVKRLLELRKKMDAAMSDPDKRTRIILSGDDELSDLAAKIDSNIAALKEMIGEKKEIIREMEESERNLRGKTAELERLNSLSVGRELKMVELKKKIDEYEGKRIKGGDADGGI